MKCDHWEKCNVAGGGCCRAGHYNGRPSLGVCGKCPHRIFEGVQFFNHDTIAKIKQYAQYAAVEATHALRGPASDADAAARLAICMGCEHRAETHKDKTDEAKIGWCTKCGCGNNPRAKLQVKVTLAGAECPMKKWGKVEGTGAGVVSVAGAAAGVVRSIIHKLKGENP